MDANTTTKTNHKRPRVTKAQALEREERIYSLLASRSTPASLAEISFAAGLTYSTTASVLRKLAEDGMIRRAGREGRKILYAHLDPNPEGPPAEATQPPLATVLPFASVTEEAPVEPVPEKEEAAPTPTELPAVAINAVLKQIHLGRDLEVIGFHLEQGDTAPLLDLRSHDGEVVTVQLVSQS